jgi:putative ubiquitin-RnfH superfamily antitoxin RatB of RatAB toxin-antitoxin module
VNPPRIDVEIVYALPDRQVLRRILIPDGSTVGDAIRASGLRAEFPEIDPTRVGIHGKPVPVDATLRDGDRVELYRPLRADPKEIRRTRAAKRRAKG